MSNLLFCSRISAKTSNKVHTLKKPLGWLWWNIFWVFNMLLNSWAVSNLLFCFIFQRSQTSKESPYFEKITWLALMAIFWMFNMEFVFTFHALKWYVCSTFLFGEFSILFHFGKSEIFLKSKASLNRTCLNRKTTVLCNVCVQLFFLEETKVTFQTFVGFLHFMHWSDMCAQNFFFGEN